jgi:hypothetical protein
MDESAAVRQALLTFYERRSAGDVSAFYRVVSSQFTIDIGTAPGEWLENQPPRLIQSQETTQTKRRPTISRVRCLTAWPLASGRPAFTFTGPLFDLRSDASRRLNPGVSGEHPQKSYAH